MPAHRILFEFEGTVGAVATAGSRAGWSEAWYSTGDVDDAGAANQALAYAASRRTLLTPGWSLTAIRVSRLSPSNQLLRKGVLILIPPAQQPGTYGTPAAFTDEQPYDAINISVATENGNHRSFLMRGIDGRVIGASGRFQNPPTWNTAFALWLQTWRGDPIGHGVILQLPPMALRIRSPHANGPVAAVALAGQLGASPQTPVVDLVTTAAFGQDDVIQFSGSTGLSRFNGVWAVDAVLAGAGAGMVRVRLKARRRVAVTGALVLPGTFRAWSWELDKVVLMTGGNGTSRRTGRPPQVPRGRRSARNA